jgi:hypothetical protein
MARLIRSNLTVHPQTRMGRKHVSVEGIRVLGVKDVFYRQTDGFDEAVITVIMPQFAKPKFRVRAVSRPLVTGAGV